MTQPASLKRNIINLFISQGASFFIPLLQFPYLTRVLGVEEFGLFVFSYSVILFFMIITNYGFELFLPHVLARPENKNKLNQYFTETCVIRVFLFCVSLIGLLGVYWFTPYYKGRELLIFLVTSTVFFNSFTLLWLFQSQEVIYLYSRITVIIRLISLGLIFLLVKNKDDLPIVLGLLSITSLTILITSYLVARKYFLLQFVKVNIASVIALVKECFEYFLSRLGVSAYATLGGFIIGTFSGSLSQVAFYGAAHQLYTAGLYAVSSISTPLLPYMARTGRYNVWFKVLCFSMLLTLLGSAMGLLAGEYIIQFIYGEEIKEAKAVLDVFMITILVSVIGQHLGYPALLPLGKGREANLSVMYAGLSQVIMVACLVLFKLPITAISIAVTYLICDLVMSSYRGAVFIKAYEMNKA